MRPLHLFAGVSGICGWALLAWAQTPQPGGAISTTRPSWSINAVNPPPRLSGTPISPSGWSYSSVGSTAVDGTARYRPWSQRYGSFESERRARYGPDSANDIRHYTGPANGSGYGPYRIENRYYKDFGSSQRGLDRYEANYTRFDRGEGAWDSRDAQRMRGFEADRGRMDEQWRNDNDLNYLAVDQQNRGRAFDNRSGYVGPDGRTLGNRSGDQGQGGRTLGNRSGDQGQGGRTLGNRSGDQGRSNRTLDNRNDSPWRGGRTADNRRPPPWQGGRTLVNRSSDQRSRERAIGNRSGDQGNRGRTLGNRSGDQGTRGRGDSSRDYDR
ncbi:MAG TPA: hypothetical protein PKG54_09175 [Phycisphaerae bacterium]|jgi:hypothetical protein|nr:hypothetical protein [Phycisphaerae bacterium]HOB74687.1 hypothetical protein [Phycisphaerae bacterium]HOJ53600.1 hypothetical protein [Phycisphaerae bacterium]HOL26325.1 hypothetical protein [Phycisphaerae bacterium]HPP22522.1 hypothetical protein [Phycisphaerae bacterium]